MESLNLSETQNIPLNSKNTASNTSPIACACCGSKCYVQILPQPYCFRTRHPDMPRCKKSQDNSEENITDPQSFYSPFPLLHPFFHNSLLPVNSFYVHNHLHETSLNDENKQQESKRESRPQTNQDSVCQKEKNDFRESKTAKIESPENYTNASESGPQFPGHPFNLLDPQFDSILQRWSWGDPNPWTCSAFIAPIISYCLFWNSQKVNTNNLFKNYTANATDTLSQKNNENTSQTYSNADNDAEEFSKDFDRECINERNSSTERKSCSPDGCLEVERYENSDRGSRNSIAASLSSDLNYSEENSFKHMEKEENIIRYPKTGSEEEDAEMEGFDSAVQVESDDCFKIDEKELLNSNTVSCFLPEFNENIKFNRSQSLERSGIPDIMVRNNIENVANSETQLHSSDTSAVDENTFLLFQDLDNGSGKQTVFTETKNFRERLSSKKSFENFIVGDQASSYHFYEPKNSVAAAGDLGGENCVGYKMIIEPFEKNDEGKACQESEFKVSELNEFEPKDFENLEKNKSENTLGKNSNENPKSTRHFKSGIAKFLNNSKSKESKTNTLKNSKPNKESNQKEPYITKRKHNCVSNSTSVSVNDISKIQKTRNCSVVQHQITGPEKQRKEMNMKSQPIKKEKKFQRLKTER